MTFTPPDPGFVAAFDILSAALQALEALVAARPEDTDLILARDTQREALAKLRAHPLAPKDAPPCEP